MTKDEILNIPAGREMDTLVAEKVMGFRVEGNIVWFPDGDFSYLVPDLGGHWSPSTDIAAAWEVVERIREKQTEIRIRGMEWYDGGGWIVEIMDILSKKVQYKSYVEVTGPKRGIPNVCLAICRAGLLAVLTNSIKEKT